MLLSRIRSLQAACKTSKQHEQLDALQPWQAGLPDFIDFQGARRQATQAIRSQCTPQRVYPIQLLVYMAPGTGKSLVAWEAIAQALMKDGDCRGLRLTYFSMPNTAGNFLKDGLTLFEFFLDKPSLHTVDSDKLNVIIAKLQALTAKAEAVHDLSRDYENILLQPLLDFLGTRNSIRLIGPRTAQHKAPTVAVHSQRTGEDLAKALAPRGIMAGGGDFYGVRCLKGLGINPDHGVLRLSFVHYTRREDIDHLIGALEAEI